MNTAGPLAVSAAYAERLMVDAAVWRKETVTDAGGGQSTGWVDQARTVRVQLVAPSAQERETAAQQGVEVTHAAAMPTDVDVVRGDRLVVDGLTVELTSDPLTATHSAVSRAQAQQEHWDEPTS